MQNALSQRHCPQCGSRNGLRTKGKIADNIYRKECYNPDCDFVGTINYKTNRLTEGKELNK